jgi:hypothetical protein
MKRPAPRRGRAKRTPADPCAVARTTLFRRHPVLQDLAVLTVLCVLQLLPSRSCKLDKLLGMCRTI